MIDQRKRTHDLRPSNLPLLVALASFQLGNVFLKDTGCQFHTSHRHCRRCLLERGKSTIQIQRHFVSSLAYRFFVYLIVLRYLQHKSLRIAVAEVEARGLKHHTFETYDILGMALENL